MRSGPRELGRRSFLAAACAAMLAGCGSNPPCAVAPAQVDAARAGAKAAEAKLDVAAEERDRLASELETLEAELREAEAKQDAAGGSAGSGP